MTTQSKFRLLVLLACIFMGSNSFSQTSNVRNLQFPLSNVAAGKAYSKILNRFESLFPGAENVNLYPLKKNIAVSFRIKDVRYQVVFSNHGRPLYKITQGNQELLPANVSKLVKRWYGKFMINQAFLVEENDRQIWVVNLEDDSKYVIASVEDDVLNENLKYTKLK